MNHVTMMGLGQWQIPVIQAGAAAAGIAAEFLTRGEEAKRREELAKQQLVIPPPPLPPIEFIPVEPTPLPQIEFPFEKVEEPWYFNPLVLGGIAAAAIGAYFLFIRR